MRVSPVINAVRLWKTQHPRLFVPSNLFLKWLSLGPFPLNRLGKFSRLSYSLYFVLYVDLVLILPQLRSHVASSLMTLSAVIIPNCR